MNKYRTQLPQLGNKIFLSDGGLETNMVYLEQIDLPEFAAITLMDSADKRQIVRNYFIDYLRMARRFGVGFILESVTWRGDVDWAGPLGYTAYDLAQLNRDAIRMLHQLRDEFETPACPIVVSGCIGPWGDAYDASQALSAKEALRYHAGQIRIFREEQADLVTAMTLMNASEAIGITRAAQAENIPVVISFTLETDGRLPDGQPLAEAIEEVDAATGQGPAYYMLNCAHPTHFLHTLRGSSICQKRIRGIRANASCKSHAELNESEELDIGEPNELASRYVELQAILPNLTVLGGCCGTDYRHIEAIAHRCCFSRREF